MHAVLRSQRHRRVRRFQSFKQRRGVRSFQVLIRRVGHGGQLHVITDEHEPLGPERLTLVPPAVREGNQRRSLGRLRRLVDDDAVEAHAGLGQVGAARR